MIAQGGEGPGRQTGFRHKLVVCKACGGSGLVVIKAVDVLGKPNAKSGPSPCRNCKATGCVAEIHDPLYETRL